MGLLNDLGLKYDADKSSRFHNYLDFYEQHLPDRNFAGRLLEIGIMDGVSMKMWAEFYPKAEIVGIDVVDKEHLYNDDWQLPRSIKLLTLDGTKAEDVRPLGMFDIIIDDGSHFTADQQASFELLYYDQLNEGGIYIVEDIWTSRMTQYVNSELDMFDWLEKKGITATVFKHEHNGIGSIVFPEYPEYKDLGSETALIRAGQKGMA
jgi:hypothetical protein